MIDDEGERDFDRGHQGPGAWARRQADGELADESTDTDPEDTPPVDPAAAGGRPNSDPPTDPAGVTGRSDSDPEAGSDAGAGDRAERAAFIGEGSYSGGRFAGER